MERSMATVVGWLSGVWDAKYEFGIVPLPYLALYASNAPIHRYSERFSNY